MLTGRKAIGIIPKVKLVELLVEPDSSGQFFELKLA
jgi:hypothetical protein